MTGIRWDTANRNFFTLVAVALVPYLALGVVGCGFLSVLTYAVGSHGLHVLSGNLLPATLAVAVVAVGTGLAAWSLRAQVIATRRLAHHVRTTRLPTPPALARAAGDVAAQVDYVDDEAAFSFAYGLGRARLVVSRGLFEMLEPPELDAVLAHERHHIANFDPLKVVVTRVLAAAYFFLPALRGLRTRYSAASELAADRRAMRRCGKAALAGALHGVVRGPAWGELATAAAIGGPEFLDARVRQLETGVEPSIEAVSRGAIVATACVLLALVTTIAATLVLVGPTTMMGRNQMMDGDMGGMSMGGSWLLGLVVLLLTGLMVWRMAHRRPS
jgi:Zn-dependent protease with chaperone function